MSEVSLTEAQRLSIEQVHARFEILQPLDQFTASARPVIGWDDGSIMINAKGVWIGIETDGSRYS